MNGIDQSNSSLCSVPEIVEKAKKYIDENFDKDLRRDDIARKFALNPVYFSRVFKRQYGQSFSNYLTIIRIKYAVKLILETNESIAVIAETVGYSDPNYFSRVFKKLIGKSPADYRAEKFPLSRF